MGIVVKRSDKQNLSELRKVGDQHYADRLAREERLLEGLEQNKLKSARLIKEAKLIKKKRAAAANK